MSLFLFNWNLFYFTFFFSLPKNKVMLLTPFKNNKPWKKKCNAEIDSFNMLILNHFSMTNLLISFLLIDDLRLEIKDQWHFTSFFHFVYITLPYMSAKSYPTAVRVWVLKVRCRLSLKLIHSTIRSYSSENMSLQTDWIRILTISTSSNDRLVKVMKSVVH